MANRAEKFPHGDVADEQARALAWVIDRAVDRGVRRGIADHEERMRALLGLPAPVSTLQMAEIVAWLGVQWADTGLWDVEAAAERFDIPPQILWPELSRYFEGRRRGWRDYR